MDSNLMIASPDLARRMLNMFLTTNLDLYRVQSEQGIAAMEIIPIGDGVLFRHPDYPSRSRVLGFGHDDLPYDKLVPQIEELFREVGIDGQVYLTPFAHPSAYRAFGDHGWHIGFWQTILVRPLDPNEKFPDPDPRISLISGEEVPLQSWTETMADGFSDFPVLEFDRPETHLAFAESTGRQICLAYWEGEPAAGASWIHDGDDMGFIANAATRPAFRKRGLHSAMIYYRLKKCIEEGRTWATYNAETGSNSQRNAMRHGFRVLYNYPSMMKKLR